MPTIVAMLTNPSPKVRAAAAEALGKIGDTVRDAQGPPAPQGRFARRPQGRHRRGRRPEGPRVDPRADPRGRVGADAVRGDDRAGLDARHPLAAHPPDGPGRQEPGRPQGVVVGPDGDPRRGPARPRAPGRPQGIAAVGPARAPQDLRRDSADHGLEGRRPVQGQRAPAVPGQPPGRHGEADHPRRQAARLEVGQGGGDRGRGRRESPSTRAAITSRSSPTRRSTVPPPAPRGWPSGRTTRLQVWVNGKSVFRHDGDRGFTAAQDEFDINLAKGKNRIVLRSGNTSGNWQFSAGVSASDDHAFLQGPASGGFDPDKFRAEALKGKGKAERGKALFSDLKGVACIKCHAVAGQGGAVGPELGGVGVKYPREELITSVLYPSQRISSGYEPVILATADGRVADRHPQERDARGDRDRGRRGEADQARQGRPRRPEDERRLADAQRAGRGADAE